MRVLHVVPTYVPAWRHGGPIRSVHGLCRALVELGHEVHVATTDTDIDGRVPRATVVEVDGVLVRYFPVTRPARLYRSPALRRAVEEDAKGFDVFHLHSVFLQPIDAAGAAARRSRVPYVLAPRGMLVPELFRRRGQLRKQAWLALAGRRLIRRAAALHATTQAEADDAAALRIDLPPVRVIPNGVDAPTVPDRREIPQAVAKLIEDGPFLLFLGRLSWKKGLERTIAALAHLPAGRLLIAGNDDEGISGKLRALAKQCGVADRVELLGPVDGAVKAALLADATALVLCSHSENFGNVVLEAMAAGTAVVVTAEVGLAPTIAAEGCGLVTDGQPEAIASAMTALLADPDQARKLGARGARVARERYSWPAVAQQVETLYSELVAPLNLAARRTAQVNRAGTPA